VQGPGGDSGTMFYCNVVSEFENINTMKTLAKSNINPIHRGLMIATSLGFAGAVGIVSAIVLIFG
jgi:hypothetical protein